MSSSNPNHQRRVRRRQALLAARAQQHRGSPSRAESLLWSALCRGQLGVRFRRQVVVGEFIVDFLAPSVRVIVELDGDEHRLKRSADASRDRRLRRLGYRVVRVLDRDLDRVVGVVRAAVRGGYRVVWV